tara:strand:- start:883 stop:1176 length:294 start_codon:yes stop_codon:yes gene_type:complete
MKIEILDGWVDLNEKACREVSGTVNINGHIYNWELETDDGFTSICFVDDDGKIIVNLEDVEDSVDPAINFGEDEGIEIYEEILDLVSEDYSIEGWDE